MLCRSRCIAAVAAACWSGVRLANGLPVVAWATLFARRRAQPHQRRGGVVLAVVGAHAVEAAVIHQVGFLEAALAGDDVVVGHEHRAVRAHEAIGLRRGEAVGRRRRPGQQREGENGDGEQHPFEHVADGVLDRRIDAFGMPASSFHLPFSAGAALQMFRRTHRLPVHASKDRPSLAARDRAQDRHHAECQQHPMRPMQPGEGDRRLAPSPSIENGDARSRVRR